MWILMRMLKPTELKVMQGFPNDYIIGYDLSWRKMSVAGKQRFPAGC